MDEDDDSILDVEHISLSDERCHVCGKSVADIAKELKNDKERQTWNGCIDHLNERSALFSLHTLDEEFIRIRAHFRLCPICEDLFGLAKGSGNKTAFEEIEGLREIVARLMIQIAQVDLKVDNLKSRAHRGLK